MPKRKNKALLWKTCYIDHETGEKVIIAEKLEDGTVVHYNPPRWKEYQKKILNRLGEHMSEYAMNHPESAMWR